MATSNEFIPRECEGQAEQPDSTPASLDGGRAHAVALLREQLEEDRHYFTDVSAGAGTEYAFDGSSYGAGFVDGRVRVLADGAVEVRLSSGITIPEQRRRDVRKLFRCYNRLFIVEGLKLSDAGEVVFEPALINMDDSDDAVCEVVGCACSVMHAYAGIPVALEAGAAPWALMDYREIPDEDSGTFDPAPTPVDEADDLDFDDDLLDEGALGADSPEIRRMIESFFKRG